MQELLLDKVCLITGTTRGIGKRTAEIFAQNGAQVYATARENNSLKEWAVSVNNSATGTIYPLYFDITDSSGILNAIKCIKQNSGKLDVLVNNAGMVTNELIGLISMETTRQMFDVNVFGVLELSQLVISKLMRRQEAGSIINIASAVATQGCKGQVAYSASKGAIISMTKSMAKELSSQNIRVNAIAPGMIGTDRIMETIESKYNNDIPFIGMGKLGETDDVANMCLFLASNLSNYVTGQVIEVSGDIKL